MYVSVFIENFEYKRNVMVATSRNVSKETRI